MADVNNDTKDLETKETTSLPDIMTRHQVRRSRTASTTATNRPAATSTKPPAVVQQYQQIRNPEAAETSSHSQKSWETARNKNITTTQRRHQQQKHLIMNADVTNNPDYINCSKSKAP